MSTTTREAGTTASELARLHELLEGAPPPAARMGYWASLNEGQRAAVAESYRALLDSRGVKIAVYVVAWIYDTGGGFDWFFSEEAAEREHYGLQDAVMAYSSERLCDFFFCVGGVPACYDRERVTRCVQEIFDTITYPYDSEGGTET